MKQHRLSVALVALAIAILAPIANAQATGGNSFEKSFQIRFTRSAPSVAAASMTYQDSITFASSADTVRTSNINTDGWDWSSANGTTAVRAIAEIAFYIPSAYPITSYGDTINFVIEPSFDGGKTYVSNLHTWTTIGTAGLGQAVGNYALKNGALGGTNAYNSVAANGHYGTVYRGLLMWSPNAVMTSVQTMYYLYGIRDFRLKIFGGNAAIGAVRAYVYPLTQHIVR